MIEVINMPIRIAPFIRYSISRTVSILLAQMDQQAHDQERSIEVVPSREDTKPHRRVLQDTSRTVTREIRAYIVFRSATTKTDKVYSVASNDAKASRSQANKSVNDVTSTGGSKWAGWYIRNE